jgi:tetratricopeptide (TPR) repeat protein
LNPLWFHLSAFLLFLALCLLLAFVIRRLLDPDLSATQSGIIALTAAACYGLHPANSDTVNYIIASAEIISTLGVIASFALYLSFPRLRMIYLYAFPAAIAVLAKPPAAIFPVLLGIFCICFPERMTGDRRGWRKILAWCRDVLPALALCAVALLFVQHMTPRTWVAGATNAKNYLMTQPYVTMLYTKTFFWPTGLSGDYDLSPLESVHDIRFWTGLLFVGLVLAGSVVAMFGKATRLIGFGLLWFLAALLPTSLFPLAEVMNDHRSFFPYIGLIIAGAGVVSVVVRRAVQPGRALKLAATAAVILFLSLNAYGTWERNKIWKSEESFWHDVTIKGPGNARGLMNYGTTLMAKGDFNGALDYFHRAGALASNYPVLLINLAIAENATKQSGLAEKHFREALRLAPAIPDSYTYYARWLLSQNRVDEAQLLLQEALEFSPADLNAQELLAKAHGRSDAKKTPEFYLNLSLRYYEAARYVESIEACEAALAQRPDYAEAWNNIGAAYNKLGQFEKGAVACEQSLRLKPDFQLARNNLEYARQMSKR